MLKNGVCRYNIFFLILTQSNHLIFWGEAWMSGKFFFGKKNCLKKIVWEERDTQLRICIIFSHKQKCNVIDCTHIHALMYDYTHICLCTHMCVQIYTQTCLCTHMRISIHVYTHVWMCTHVRTFMYVCTHTHVCMYTHMFV